MTSTRRVSQIPTLVVLLALLVTPIWSYAGMMGVSFHGDESQNIFMARYFDLFFLKRDFSNPEWDTTVFWAVTHPPVSKYLIGLALFVTGHDFSKMHHPWRWKYDDQTNFALGNVPSTSALFVSRAMMTCLLALSIVLCGALAFRLSGLVGALVAGPSFALSGLALTYLRRATPDAPLEFFSLLAVVSSMKLLDCFGTRAAKAFRRTMAWAALTGLWLGLAGGSKLSGAALLPVAFLPPGISWLVLKAEGDTLVRGGRLLAVYAVLVTVTVAVFVLPNPTLYENPREGIEALIATRLSQAEGQQQAAPGAALTTVPARVGAMIDEVFHPVALLVFVCGLGLVVGQEFLHWTRGVVTGRTVVLMWVGGTLAFTALLTPLDWPRYFVPLIPCQAVVLGYLASEVVRVLRQRLAGGGHASL